MSFICSILFLIIMVVRNIFSMRELNICWGLRESILKEKAASEDPRYAPLLLWFDLYLR
jgi:hypothetical protein